MKENNIIFKYFKDEIIINVYKHSSSVYIAKKVYDEININFPWVKVQLFHNCLNFGCRDSVEFRSDYDFNCVLNFKFFMHWMEIIAREKSAFLNITQIFNKKTG